MVNIKKDTSTEERILAAAEKIFVSKGMAGARTQDIADEAGINKALLHYYFRNKEQLFETVFANLTRDFWQQINDVFESESPLFEKIETFCQIYITKVLENPYIPMFILYEMGQRPTSFVKTLFRGKTPKPDKFIQQIAREVKEGRIREIKPAQLLMNMISMCVFPFVAKPVFTTALGIDDATFKSLMHARKKEVPQFIIQSLKP